MGILRSIAAAVAATASFQALALDAARCAETRRYIAQLEDNLRRSPAASDRQAFERSLVVYRKAEAEFCGSAGAGAGGGMAPSSRAANAAAQMGAVTNTLQALGEAMARHDAASPPTPVSTLPEPPAPSGSVTAPMTMHRLGGVASPSVRTPGISVSRPATGSPQVAVTTPSLHEPRVTLPDPRPLDQDSSSPFPTDQQIAVQCVGAANPSMCELGLQSRRNQDPAYRRWQAERNARLERNIDTAMANLDATIATSRQQGTQQTAPSDASTRVAIPRLPPPRPYDNSDPELAKCREGEIAPWTIAGCYDLGGKPPGRDTASEQRAILQWQADAGRRLAEAIRNGRQVVRENREARAACHGTWMYDGLSEGSCTPGPYPLVYAITIPGQR